MPDDSLTAPPRSAAHPTTVPPGPAADTSPPSDDAVPSDAIPVGPPGYELLGEVGRGGMGVVYRARDRELDRDVAVKLLRDHFPADSAAARRFTDEARITGQLQHPGIPAVHQVGTLPDGRPFLAMKLVRGRTLDELLKDGGGEPRRSLNLLGVFEQVCQAVGYAHAHGVVHRDLKPANVMVGAYGEVQVMDWGLAKVLASGTRQGAENAADPDATLGTEIRTARGENEATQAGSLLGTPAYMPPEQAIGAVDQIDERSDVFGLGAVLCAVLTGKPPYIGEDAESTRQLAARGKLDDAFTRLDACGAEPELVALCKRCLSVEKADRPADAGEVAAAVHALRAAADERARRAELDRVRAEAEAREQRKRRRVLLVSAGLVAGVLAAGAGGAAWQAVRATNAETATAKQLVLTKAAEAEAKAAEVKARDQERKAGEAAELARLREMDAKDSEADTKVFSDFLVDYVLAASRPAGVQQGIGVDVKMSEALLKAEKDIDKVFAGRPKAEATARHAIGVTWRNLAKYDRAEAHLKRAVELRRRELGPAAVDTLNSVNSLGVLYSTIGKYIAAEPLLREALAGAEKALGPDHLQSLTSVDNLAALLAAKGDYPAAEPLSKRALAGYEKVCGPDHPDTLASVNNLAGLLREKGDSAAAEPLYRRALAGYEKVRGPDHPATLTSVSNLANLLQAKGDLAAAEPLLRRALAGYEKVRGPDHPYTLTSVNNLALLLKVKEDLAAAEPLLRRALAGREKALGPDHPDTLKSVANLAALYFDMRRYADAVPLLKRAARGFAARPGMAGAVPLIRGDLGLSLLATGTPADAEAHLLAGYENLSKRKTFRPADRKRLWQVTQGLVELYEGTNRPEKAAEWRAKVKALPPEVAPRPRPAK